MKLKKPITVLATITFVVSANAADINWESNLNDNILGAGGYEACSTVECLKAHLIKNDPIIITCPDVGRCPSAIGSEKINKEIQLMDSQNSN